jgi:hypothetical protein
VASGRHSVSILESGRPVDAREVVLAENRIVEVDGSVAAIAAEPRHWIAASAATGVFGLAGVGLGVAAQNQRNELFSSPHSRGTVNGFTARIAGYSTGANVAYAAAGVAAMTAILLFLFEGRAPGSVAPPGSAP